MPSIYIFSSYSLSISVFLVNKENRALIALIDLSFVCTELTWNSNIKDVFNHKNVFTDLFSWSDDKEIAARVDHSGREVQHDLYM